jgi:hypothetical protein
LQATPRNVVKKGKKAGRAPGSIRIRIRNLFAFETDIRPK